MKSSSNNTHDYQTKELNLSYVICEVVVAIFAVFGNALVIYVFYKERRLRRRTNYYIVSLAVADFLVGLLGIPFAILSSIGLPNNLHACLFTVSLLVVLCTISIFCLVGVSVDRYWAILHPMAYNRHVRTKTALVIISICWFAGSLIGFLPLFGWYKEKSDMDCFFLNVMDHRYLVFLYFGTIITPALVLIAFYAHIYRVILRQLRQMVVMNPAKTGGKSCKNLSSGGMIRMLNVQQRNEVKATQNLAIIVLFFMLCWIPLYTINCLIAFDESFQVNSTFMFSCIILSHLNSAGNPLLYAYHLKDFRAALKTFFCNLLGIPQRKVPSAGPSYYRTQLATKSFELTKIKMDIMVKSTPDQNLEDSERNSKSSEDSLASQKRASSFLMRAATPYCRNSLHNKEINKILIDSSSPIINSEENLQEMVFLDNNKSSSPQLSKGLFFVEYPAEELKITNNLKFSPRKIVSTFLKNRPNLNRSLSDTDSLEKFNGFIADYYSVPM